MLCPHNQFATHPPMVVNEKGDLQYWIAIEAKESKFGE
jgi:hypothetical protein